jgi:beta-1,4-N-acetylglucosaminyltransferase
VRRARSPPRGRGRAATDAAASSKTPNSAAASGKRLFVTVGTTSFDALLAALDRPKVVATLRARGFTSVAVQFGRGEASGRVRNLVSRPGLEVSMFAFKPSLEAEMRASDLVITHAGAGSIFECLAVEKPCLVVVNERLMGNHQAELAEALAERGHLRWCVPANLEQALAEFEPESLVPYEGGDPEGVARALDQLLSC